MTGSTDGIGKEYAKQLAQRGLNIILIARNLTKLTEVSAEIGKSSNKTKLLTVQCYIDLKIFANFFCVCGVKINFICNS